MEEETQTQEVLKRTASLYDIEILVKRFLGDKRGENLLRTYAINNNIDLTKTKVGVWSRVVRLKDTLIDGDRIEIYRPLIADPKEIRKLRAQKAKEEGRVVWRLHFVCGQKTAPGATKLMQDADVPSMHVSCCVPSKTGDDPVLLCPITSHCMVPLEYRVLMPDEVAGVKRMYHQLPRMKPDDQQALARGLIVGTVVKVIMPNMLGDQYAEVRA